MNEKEKAMSEDRLESALREMKQEDVDAATLEAARVRVWDTMMSTAATGASGAAGCAEVRPDFGAYLSGAVTGGRRVLIDDHISRCAACRTVLAEMKGDRRVIAMPRRSSSRWKSWGLTAAAAALILSGLYVNRDTLDAWMAPGGPRATVVSTGGGLYRLSEGVVEAGAGIGERERIRTGPGTQAVLRLADGSTVDVNERTELFVTAAWSGLSVHLLRGDVIVKAAKQRHGSLRVLTRDSVASVKGTVFAVSAGMRGSRVSVVEGSVQVNQPGRDVLLRPGEQAASNPALVRPVAESVSWSADAEQYLQLLASFANIERRVAAFPAAMRTNPVMLTHLPSGAFIYGAVPNPGGKIGHGLAAAEQQASENDTFRVWWDSDTGLQLRGIVDRVQSVSGMLGEEIVFSVAWAGPREEVPTVMAAVRPGQREALASAFDGLFAEAGEQSRPYSINDELMVISDTPAHLAWAISRLGQGASSPFAAAIGARYQRGAGWLIGVDAAPVIAMASEDDAPPIDFARMTDVKYLFLEQRSPEGAEENEVTVMFGDRRTGMASWLADTGTGGAAEYLPADSLAAGYVSMREPGQLFEEFTALMTRERQSFDTDLTTIEGKLGAGFVANVTSAMGTEAAFALNGFSVNGPAWTMVALANDPAVIDASIAKLVETVNAELTGDEQNMRGTLAQESVGGRTWHTLKAGNLPFGATWTYDGGFLVAASDRATAERAIATRSGGVALVWSPAFQEQLPGSAGIHPSGFAWLNTKGALGIFSALSQGRGQGVSKLLEGRDPVLVVFDGKPDLIHAASRTRLSGVILDAMVLGSLSETLTPAAAGTKGQ